MKSVLIVEDDHDTADGFAELIQAEGLATSIANSLAQAREQLLVHRPDIVLLDLHLPDGSGMDLFEDPALRGNAEIILMTGNASVETSVQALRLGAADYLIKPVSPRLLMRAIVRTSGDDNETAPAGEPAASRSPENSAVKAQEKPAKGSGSGARRSTASSHSLANQSIAGSSAVMTKIFDQIRKVARTSVSVLVVGESGTGKELVAQQVHQQSRRRNGPFKALNCGAISSQLIESELFGHEKGSFTGAIKQHKGIFEQADGGTLFLDEVTEMPMDLQVRLLRVLETGTFARVGSTDLQQADVRIVAATNRNPEDAVRKSLLREDLYYRLNVFQIALPPLRERIEDIQEIAEALLDKFDIGLGERLQISDRALEQLKQHHWPGNVRELRNMIQRGAVMAENGIIDSIPMLDGNSGNSATSSEHGMQISLSIGTTIADAERKLILATLRACDGAKEQAADMLGISPKTLYNRLRSYEQTEG